MISVTVGGFEFEEIESLSFSRSLDALCGKFEMECFPEQVDLNSLGDEEKLVIRYKNSPVLTGTIDSVSASLSSDSKSLTVSGRDVTSILVDSSAIHNPMGFENITLYGLAQALCTPFRIPVHSSLDSEIHHANWYLSYGETIFDALDRMAKIEGAFFLTSGLGELQIQKPWIGPSSFALVEGKNFSDLKFSKSQRGLFNKYLLATYSQGLGNAIQPLSQITDPDIKTKRTLIVDAEGLSSQALAMKRLEYEMKTRRARSLQIMAQVPGWVDESGAIFEMNTLTQVTADSLGIQGHYLITGLDFRLDSEQGYFTTITLYSSDAYLPDPTAQLRLNALMDLVRRDH